MALGLSTYVGAQSSVENEFDQIGLRKQHNYFSPESFEYFDTTIGNVTLTFTDLVLPGNADRELRFQRTYNNRDMSSPTGWRIGLAGMVMSIVDGGDPPDDYQFINGVDTMILWTPRLITADGGPQVTIYRDRPDTNNADTKAASMRWVVSSRFFKYDRQAHRLYMPDGTVCDYQLSTTVPNGNRTLNTYVLKEIRDPFGNKVEILRDDIAAPTITTFRQHLDASGNSFRDVVLRSESGRPTSLTFGTRVWQYDYDPLDTSSHKDIKTVTMPEGLVWTFDYGGIAEVVQITTPQGGRIHYDWETIDIFPNSPLPLSKRMLHYRDSYDRDGTHLGHWIFEWAGGPPDAWQTKLTLPSEAVVFFTHGPLTCCHAFDDNYGTYHWSVGTPGQPALETTQESYTVVPTVTYSADSWFGTPEVTTRTIVRDGLTYTTTYTYDLNATVLTSTFGDYHHPTQIVEAGQRTRTATFHYRHYGHRLDPPALYRVALPLDQLIHLDGDTQEFATSWDYFPDTGALEHVTRFGLTTRYTYNAEGNAETVREPHDQVTTYTYTYAQPTTIQTPQYTITREINPDSTVASETRGTRITLYEYDDLMRPTKVIPPGGSTPILSNPTNTTYESASSIRVQRGNSWTQTTLDGFGRATETLNSMGVKTTTTYNAEGRVEHEGIPYSNGLNLSTLIEYDALGRVRKRTNPGGSYTEWQYGAGQVQVRDEKTRVTVQRWDAFGDPDNRWLVEVIDAKNQHWNYAYNALGSLKSVIAPDGKSRTWMYNNSNQLITETHPESGQTQYSYIGDLLAQKTDANGNSFTYLYDTNGRLKSQSVAGKTTTITYEPNSDQRQSVTTSNGSTSFTHDTVGRVQERKDVIDAYVFSSQYIYDANDNVVQITYPSQRQIQYEYDSENRPTHVSEPLTPRRDYATQLTYHPSGALERYVAGNNIETTLTFDLQRYWIRTISSGALQLSYDDYDAAGNVHTITDSRPGGMTQQFTYDELDRLKTVVGPLSEVFEYDVHGNRTDANGATYQYEPGTLRLANRNGVAYGYDLNGNLRSAGPNTFTYAPENWLATAALSGGTRTYSYDSEGWRSKRTAPGDATFYARGLANEVLTEWHLSGTTPSARDYIYAGGRLIAAVSRNSSFPTMCGGTVGPDGSPQSVSVASGNTGSVSFEGSACRRVSAVVSVTSGTFGCTWALSLKAPDGPLLPNPGLSCGTSLFMEPVLLEKSGQYSAVVDPAGTGSGAATVRLYDVVDYRGSIALDGTATPVPITTPGQRGLLTFSGTAGTKVSAAVAMSLSACVVTTIYKPDMTTLAGQNLCGASGFLEPVELPTDGVYMLSLDPQGATLMTITARMWAFTDYTGSIEVGGPAVSVPQNSPGQKSRFTFQGTQGWRVSAVETFSSGSGCGNFRIYRPDMTVLSNALACPPSAGFQEAVTLPTTGNYTFEVDPQYGATMTVAVQLFNAADYVGSIGIGGSLTVSLVPGQIANLTMDGTNGQQVTVRLTGNSIWQVAVKLLKPDGSLLAQTTGSGLNFNLSTQTLPATGVYTVRLDPTFGSTGNITVSITSP